LAAAGIASAAAGGIIQLIFGGDRDYIIARKPAPHGAY
jgi:hypothetical protein